MAGMTVTTTEKVSQSVKEVTFEWLSDASAGTATATTAEAYDGQVLMLITEPGSTAPDANWDVTVTDAGGYDILNGEGSNRSNAVAEYVVAKEDLGAVANSLLTVNVANAGNAKTGTVILRIR